MKKHNIKAFTILEMTVSMLVAGIVIGITYTVYIIVIKSFGSFQAKNEDMQVIIRVDQLLRKDIAKADLVFKTNNGIAVQSGGQTISYDFEPDYLLRTAGIVDTFKVKIQAVNTFFENIPITEQAETEEQNRLDDLSFTLLYQEEKIPYHYHKQYSAVNLMQRKADALH